MGSRPCYHLFEQEGICVGEETFQDATDKQSLKHGPKATYSGYYKHSGCKMDTTIDADMLFPLDYHLMGITEDEGRNLIPSVDQLISYGLREKLRVVDDTLMINMPRLKTSLIVNSGVYSYTTKLPTIGPIKMKENREISDACISDIVNAMISLLTLILIKYFCICIEKVKQKQLDLISGIFACLSMRNIRRHIWRSVIPAIALKENMEG